MSGLRFASSTYTDLAGLLLEDQSRESCAIGYAHFNPTAARWVFKSADIAPENAYEKRSVLTAVLKPSFLVAAANKARAQQLSVVLIHTHPWATGIPEFSMIDDAGEVALAEYFGRRVAGGSHLALVIGPEGCNVRRLGDKNSIAVWEVGESLSLRSELPDAAKALRQYDRQIRAFGEAGQRTIGSLRIAVVGAGGTGSAVIQQLAYLGVNDFMLIEPDNVEGTNLNRLIGAIPTDVDTPKLTTAARLIKSIRPGARVEPLPRDVVDADIAPRLAAVDFIFVCTDSHASRAVINQLAYQHLVPAIDMGVSITVREGTVTHITGRVQMLAPGLPCLVCTNALDGERIRQEMLSPEQRAADPYVIGDREPQPAVVSINSTMASLAVTMFLGAVTPVPAAARFQLYDGIRGTVRPTTASVVGDCIACSAKGALARGVSLSLPVRSVARHE